MRRDEIMPGEIFSRNFNASEMVVSPPRRIEFDAGGCPARRLLSLARPRDSNQREGRPETCRCAVPCASRHFRAVRATREAKGPPHSNIHSLLPEMTEMLGGVHGVWLSV